MPTILMWTAAGIALLTFGVHTFIGGPRVAGPLLADRQLPIASKWLNYYCWHIATVLILFMAAGYGLAATDPAMRPLAGFCTALAAALGILSAAVAVKGRIHPFRLPSTSLFLAMTLAGAWALLG